jgi:hypothetical protein
MKNKPGRVKAVDRNHPAFNKNAEPFYLIIMEGLKGEVDGEHFWDAVAKDAVFEFLYNNSLARLYGLSGGDAFSCVRLILPPRRSYHQPKSSGPPR